MLTRMRVPVLAVALFAGVTVQGKQSYTTESPILIAFGHADEGIVPAGWVPVGVTDALLLSGWPDVECAHCREWQRLAGGGHRRAECVPRSGRVAGC